jgi:hypothetical protein
MCFYSTFLNTDYTDASRIMKPTVDIRTKKLLATTLPTELNFPLRRVLNYRDETTHTHPHALASGISQNGGGGGGMTRNVH